MAKYKKKRARELQHDKFRDAAGRIFDRVGDRLEGKGKALLYAMGVVVVVALVVGVVISKYRKHSQEAQHALGRAIEIMKAPVPTASPIPGAPAPAYSSEQERDQRAVEVFQQVANKYGDPYRTEARYFIATILLSTDRNKAMSELTEVSKSSVAEPAALAKFALAQALEADGKYDEAAKLYSELAAQNSEIVPSDSANLRLAAVYEKQGKKKEAVDLLFNIVESSRKAKDSDGTPLPPSSAARDASEKLQKLDADRYTKLTPEAPSGDSPF